MKIIFSVFLTFVFLICIQTLSFSQTQSYVNQEWSLQTSTLGQNDKISSALDSDGNFVFITNHQGNSNSDIVLSCVHPNGSVVWQQTCTSSSTEDDFGVDIRIDAANNVYVSGVYHNGTNYDYFIAKYQQNGTLIWESFYDNGGEDLVESMEIDAIGNVYVTGSSQDGFIPDMTTVKYDSNGSELWVKRHNISNKPEIGKDLVIDNSGNIIVGGNVVMNPNEARFLFVKYDLNGNFISDEVLNTQGNGLDDLRAIDIDAQGNIYGTGKGILLGQTTGKIVKLNNVLSTQWEVYSDYYSNGLNNDFFAVQVTSNGSIAVTGYASNNSGGTDILTQSISQSNGNIVWSQIRKSIDNFSSAKGKDLKVDQDNNIYTTGFLNSGSNNEYITTAYSENGSILWERTFEGVSGANSDASNLLVNQNEVFTTGRVISGGEQKVNTVKYDVLTTQTDQVSNGSNERMRVKGEVLVRFNPSIVNSNNINDTKKTHGVLSEFISDPSILAEFSTALGYDASKIRCYKVHPKLTTNDTTSLSRGGSLVALTPYFATLGILIPSTLVDATVFKVFLKKNKYVQSVAFNDIYSLHAGSNDPEYTNGNHAALVSTTQYPNANINIETAWDITVGTDSVICGVFDSGIHNSHTDISDGTFSGSSVSDGWDYKNGVPITTVTNPDGIGHGTGVAGIIGAWRDNSFGSVGIAGGSGTGDGVKIHDMKIFEGVDTACFPSAIAATAANIQQAIVDGAIFSPGTGTGLSQHIQNHSWGGGKNTQIQDACRTAHENEVMLVVSSGNAESGIIGECLFASYPANYKDDWITQVGASDTVGIRAGFSNCGSPSIDFVAPGVAELYQPLDHLSNGFDDFTAWGPSNACTAVMDGTSFSSPHVSGTAALMIGYYKNNSTLTFNHIAPEDCEQLIKYYAKDIDTLSMGTGVDQETGHGLLDAGATIQGIKLPDYEVIHYEFTDVNYDTAYYLQASIENDSIYGIIPNVNGPLNSVLNVNKFVYYATNSHTLPNGYDLLDGWKRDAKSTAFGDYSVPFGNPTTPSIHHFPNEISVEMVSFNETSAIMRGYVYEVFAFDLDSGAYVPVGWYPHDTTVAVTFAYSLYAHTEHASIEDKEEDLSILIYPNPASSEVTIQIKNIGDEDYLLSLYDVTGHLIMREDNFISVDGNYRLNVANLSNGVYMVQLEGDNNRYIKKLIINK